VNGTPRYKNTDLPWLTSADSDNGHHSDGPSTPSNRQTAAAWSWVDLDTVVPSPSQGQTSVN